MGWSVAAPGLCSAATPVLNIMNSLYIMSLDTATLITTFCQPIAPVSLPGQTLFKPNQPRRPGRSTYEKVEFAAATCFLGHDIADCSPSPSPPALCPRRSKETPQPGASPENYTLLKLCGHVQLVTETPATPWPGPVIRCGGVVSGPHNKYWTEYSY